MFIFFIFVYDFDNMPVCILSLFGYKKNNYLFLIVVTRLTEKYELG